jgi:hypothetical protein
MGEIYPMPSLGDVFTDVRGADRTMRLSLHRDQGAVVVSLWAATLCRGSFRMAVGDLDRLISALNEMRTSIQGRAVQSGAVQAGEARAGEGGENPGAGEAAAQPAVGSAVDPAVERTGDITEAANAVRAPFSPILRVA